MRAFENEVIDPSVMWYVLGILILGMLVVYIFAMIRLIKESHDEAKLRFGAKVIPYVDEIKEEKKR